jgi:pyrrolidone-carboxylate peptidase
VNPSGRVAFELAVRGPRGLRVVGGVLPASFQRAPEAFDQLLSGLPRPSALLALGMHRGQTFRVERQAGGVFERSDRTDVDGGVAALVGRAGGDLETRVNVDALAESLREAGAPEVEVSTDAGGYVCERVYHHVLTRANQLGVPGVFLHVPSPDIIGIERQIEIVSAFIVGLASQALAAPGA